MTCSPSCDCPHRFPRWLILRALIWLYLGIIITPPLPQPPPPKKNQHWSKPRPKKKSSFCLCNKIKLPTHKSRQNCWLPGVRSTDLKLYPLPKSQHTLLSLFYLSIPPPHLPTPRLARLALNSIVRLQGFLSHYSGHLISSASNNTKLFVTCTLAARNSFVGTAQYVSPELLTDKRAVKRYWTHLAC